MKRFLKRLLSITLSVGILTCNLVTPLYAEEVNTQIFSEETQEWLEWFNSLTYEEQITVSYRPAEIIEYLEGDNTILPELQDLVRIDSPQIGTNSVNPYDPGGGGTMVVGGYELAYNPSYWNGSRINKANCYYYVMNVVSSSTDKGKQQPGFKANSVFTSLTASNIIAAVKKDIPYFSNVVSIRSSSAGEKPGVKEYKVVLVIAPGKDYHWYRQNPDGSWSHKRGHTEVTRVDASGNTIYNPQGCNRNYGSINYSTFAGYYIVKYA